MKKSFYKFTAIAALTLVAPVAAFAQAQPFLSHWVALKEG
jgi:hypothetical protein